MKIKTSELTGAALDWAVAKVEQLTLHDFGRGCLEAWVKDSLTGEDSHLVFYRPSTDWAQGGPIIERELHNLFKWNQLDPSAPEMWCGVHNRKTESGIYAINVDGPTPLIAACRCYVAFKLGDEVDVPEELCA